MFQGQWHHKGYTMFQGQWHHKIAIRKIVVLEASHILHLNSYYCYALL